MKLLLPLFAAALVSFAQAADRPNVLVVMVDDLGYSDIGCYGSEIDTPTLDRLAANGLRFSQFYNTAKCHSSRISLLSGMYPYQAGNLDLTKCVTSAEVMSQAGYFTAMTGKWHLKNEPTDFGFERYWGHLSGACNFYKGDKTFRLNGEPWTVPESDFYTTVANVDYALTFLEEARQTEKPWYLYVAFNAPHAPLQPLEEDYRKYEGRYADGWDITRDARINKQRELDIFHTDLAPSPRPDSIPAWDTMSTERQDWESKRMSAIAGMIDRVDQELGRLVADLEASGELDNTFILFVSDNGACPYDRRAPQPDTNPYDPDVTWPDSTGWAWARNTPFRFYKQNQFEGGISTPAIMHWPAGIKNPGTITHEPAHLIDVVPTLADLAGTDIPTTWPGREVVPVSGISLVPSLKGKSIKERPPIFLQFSSDRGLRDGDWKLVSFQSSPWELYHVTTDRTELNNLADQQPERLESMIQQWHELAAGQASLPQSSQQPVHESTDPHQHLEWTNFDGTFGGPPNLKQSRKPDSLRARKDTKIEKKGKALIFTSSGDDSGLAINQISNLTEAGPYQLTFKLTSDVAGEGEIYFTTDKETILPKGEHQTFPVKAGDATQKFKLTLPTEKTIYALRFDPGNRPGTAKLETLTLRDHEGNALKSWP